MRRRNAWIITKKDLDEFRHQKFVIGSIIAMPILLGVILPGLMMVPILSMAPSTGPVWDVDQLVQTGVLPEDFVIPMTNESYEYTTVKGVAVKNCSLYNCFISHAVLDGCHIEESMVTNSVLVQSYVNQTQLWNVTLIQSKGVALEGDHIVAVDSSVTFTKEKPSEVTTVVPLILNMVLMVFIIVPATLPTIIATYSIVGEKNNRSLEPLLATPTTDGEILAGKIFSSFLPSMGATLLAFVLGVIVLDVLLTPFLGYPPLPNLIWLLSILLIAPTACLMSILACVIVSSKVSDVRAAQQVGGFVVMPVVALMLAVVSGFILLSPVMVLVFTGFYALLDVGLFYVAKAIFHRENILVNWK
ncbi:MAG: ABC transporter permease subunit [Candidatus Thermoplasmatota archaeon]